MIFRDVTGRVSRWTLILHRDEQGFANAARRLTAGGSTHHIDSVSFRSPAMRWRSEPRKCASCATEEFDARPRRA
jgi:hypothetical protein